jgi:hypothetical protein
MTVPDYALGSNGRPAIMVAPAEDTSEFALPVAVGSHVTDLPVFKTGKVKDSKGRAHNWSVADLDQMVANFTTLRDTGKFPNVPVRANHSRDVNQIGGYYTALRRKGNMLFADIEFTEPEMQAKYERKTYRARSIEIGAYESNDGEVTFPAVMGLAFCDIPAVEGLFSASVSAYENESDREVILFAAPPADAGGGGAAAGAAEDEGAEDQQETVALAAVLSALHALAGQVTDNPDAHTAVMTIIGAVQAMQSDESEDTSGEPKPPAKTNAGALVETFQFTVDGAAVEIAGDENTRRVLETFAAANTRLTERVTSLEADAETVRQESRERAVDGWLDGKKIVPAQVEGLKAYVKTLTDEQFTAHSALMDLTPQPGITAEHGGGGGEDAASTEAEKVNALRLTYSMLKTAGLPADKLAKSKPALALAALNVPVEA